MVLNEEKYELLSHPPISGNDGQDLPMTGFEYFTSSGLQITPVDSVTVRDLGVTVCSDLPVQLIFCFHWPETMELSPLSRKISAKFKIRQGCSRQN